MIFSRRTTPLIGIAICLFFLYLVSGRSRKWRQVPQAVGLGDMVSPGSWNISNSQGTQHNSLLTPQPNYVPGVPKPAGEKYSKILVVPKMKEEDTEWMAQEIPDWEHAVYVADDPTAPLHPPKNKGHEVMVYLTYIIDHYEKIPDIVAFMHSHQYAWHNDEIFGGNAADMLQRLNPARVVREGYMNLRCTWAPGCPDWMHPGALVENSEKQEETMLARSWGEIFPDVPIPDVLAQPCCAQFAVSRERILATPKSRYIFYRDWILRTELSDYISGRVWEYLWHFVFTGENVVCAKEHVCYCDGYGLCFGGEDEYDAFRGLGFQKRDLEDELTRWHSGAQSIEVARMHGPLSEKSHVRVPDPGRDIELENQIDEKVATLNELLFNATQRGAYPENRAFEAGRLWKEGDGF